ncbi:ABC transporter ATP-binding protein [Vibrio maerlii]|uniref:ABC transporter ATP-binding protein n=1 Tax=Vibrio maerlii TaxID=2231648 RepID=UPI000E3D2142|nr:ABC transporter ATP-binding protein [Vibrio maerlii]
MSLDIQCLNKEFGSVTALNNVSFSLQTGDIAALVGPSGCGKTTLLRSIAGLEKPSSGLIQINKSVVYQGGSKSMSLSVQERHLGMVFQDFALWPHLTVFENIAFGLRARKVTSNLNKKVENALEQVQLAQFADRLPNQLSGGQQQRVSIARAIVTQPELILLDEPLSALDAVLKEQIQTLLVKILKENNLTAVYVTHDQAEALSMADKVVLMNSGNIEQFDCPENIYHKPNSEFVARFIGKSNLLPKSQGNAFIRMESLKTGCAANDSDLRFDAAVKSAKFEGQHYLIQADVAGECWQFHSKHRLNEGQSISLFCSPGDVKQISKKGHE